MADVESGTSGSTLRRLRALSFGGGGFDTVMQLGVVHALLVARLEPPDHVVGISAGALNAAALAEILKEGEGCPEEERLTLQVRRLRAFLDSYLEVPRTLVEASFPDAFEINAQKPLQPLELPIHFRGERKSRDEASHSKAGAIRLMNQIFNVRITVGTITRLVRRVLALRQVGELPKSRRRLPETRAWNLYFMWLNLGRHSRAASQTLFAFVYAAIVGAHGNLRSVFGDRLLELFDRKGWNAPFNLLRRLLGKERASAGKIILSSGFARKLGRGAWDLIGIVVWLVLWAVPMFALYEVPGIPELRLASLGLHTPWGDFRFLPVVDTFANDAVAWAKAALLLTVIMWFAALVEKFIDIPLAAYAAVPALSLAVLNFPFLVLSIVTAVILASRKRRAHFVNGALTRVLEYYDLAGGILSPDVLRQQIVACFDPHYYGKLESEGMIEAALRREACASADSPLFRKKMSDYQEGKTKVHVGAVAADVQSGNLTILPNDIPVVDALLAATAFVPLLPAHAITDASSGTKRWYVDGRKVSNEPIQPLLDYLRDEYKADLEKHEGVSSKYLGVSAVDVYPVSDLPIEAGELPLDLDYSILSKVGVRALELKEFRDAAIERRLTRVYTKALPRNDSAFVETTERTFIRANLHPIEPERPARVNRRIFSERTTADRKRILRQTVADGCRAALEAFIPTAVLDWAEFSKALDELQLAPAVRKLFEDPEVLRHFSSAIRRSSPKGEVTVNLDQCAEPASIKLSETAAAKFSKLLAPSCSGVIDRHVGPGKYLPGYDGIGPGVSEICAECCLFRPGAAPTETSRSEPNPPELKATLRGLPDRRHWPRWPTEGKAAPSICFEPQHPSKPRDWRPEVKWPSGGEEGPTISLLFGGGVFRGVFHMGVMNALNEVGLQPDLVAGSSVGSIIAAMIASVFKIPATEMIQRKQKIRDLAATFIAIDRLILTDRFADFVRRLTLRAAAANFSPRDLDLLLRRFDADDAARFSDRTRNVAAGLERLSYVSPYELFDLIKYARLQQHSKLFTDLIDDLQELLERGGVGQEILGAEPLSLLIRQFVAPEIAVAPTFDWFLANKPGEPSICFLATATNLNAGKLAILGEPYEKRVSLENGLLASSAFPAIFRPRHSWELYIESSADEDFIDGGTMDNLPLDAVTRFLKQANRDKKIARRPAAPHLLFTASLEVDRKLFDSDDPKETVRSWITLGRWASTLKYNRKIDSYSHVQRRLSVIHDQYDQKAPVWPPLSLHVLAVKPNWLCGTFGFHPMLGFRRRKQVQSIAHGCAMTLAQFADVKTKHPAWWTKWHLASEFAASAPEKDPKERFMRLRPNTRSDGKCHFRPEVLCPFSARWAELNGNGEHREKTIDQLNQIYVLCGRPETHEPEAAALR